MLNGGCWLLHQTSWVGSCWSVFRLRCSCIPTLRLCGRLWLWCNDVPPTTSSPKRQPPCLYHTKHKQQSRRTWGFACMPIPIPIHIAAAPCTPRREPPAPPPSSPASSYSACTVAVACIGYCVFLLGVLLSLLGLLLAVCSLVLGGGASAHARVCVCTWARVCLPHPCM
jgi:hypothetical protein